MKQKIRFLELFWPFQKQNSTHFQTSPPSREKAENRYIVGLLILWLLVMIFGALRCKAQDRALKIGDRVPDVSIRSIYNFRSGSATISDFHGKLLILDFWASWCSPCVAAIPKLDKLQKEFGGQLQILPVNNQSPDVVKAFLLKLQKIQPFDLPDVLQDTVLNKMFPHTYLPHFVWIDGKGTVVAITSDTAVNSANIRSAIEGRVLSLKVKTDKPVDGDPDKLFETKTTRSDVISHKLIPGYQEDLPGGWNISPGDSTGKSIQCTNLLMEDLFNIALGRGKSYFGHNRVIYEVKDTSALKTDLKGEDAIDWMRDGHVYSYEIKTPPGMNDLAYDIMLQDLRNNFIHYDVEIDNRQVDCLALVKTTTDDRISTRGGKSVAKFDGLSCHMVNFPIERLVAQLNVLYMARSPYPVVDQTGQTKWVDLDINARLSDVAAVNRELDRYGLQLKKMRLSLNVLVIKDRQVPAN